MFDERKLVSIYTPIQYSLKRVKNELRKRYISSGIKPVYGKLLRPTIALFASHSFEKKDHSKDVILATALELIHNASLIHDDILDDEFMRRSDSALHIPLGLKKALLFGDSLFTQALKMIQELDHPTILSSIIETVKIMCDGQWIEINLDGKKNFSCELYLDIINKKTASLFACACKVGSLLRDASDDEVELFEKFGFQFGITYQVIDDLDDLRENPKDTIILRLIELGGKDYCYSLAREYLKKTRITLNHLPNSVVQRSYNQLVDYLEKSYKI